MSNYPAEELGRQLDEAEKRISELAEGLRQMMQWAASPEVRDECRKLLEKRND